MQKQSFREGRRGLQIWYSLAQTQAQTQPPTQSQFPFVIFCFFESFLTIYIYIYIYILFLFICFLLFFVFIFDPSRQGGLQAGPTLYLTNNISPNCIIWYTKLICAWSFSIFPPSFWQFFFVFLILHPELPRALAQERPAWGLLKSIFK